ncbi:MAG: hypothetical protein QM589_01290 [Thermomicrobiales bacterium]
MNRPLTIAIYAPSGAGKSQLAKHTAAAIGTETASRVAVDYFLVPRPTGMPREAFDRLPLRYDWNLLASRLALPIGTEMSTPDVDWDTFFRQSDTGGIPFMMRPVMLLEAMEPYPKADARVLLDIEDAERLRRIAERDLRWGTTVRERTGHLDATWERMQAMGIVPNLILDGAQPLGKNAAVLAAWIRASPGFTDAR